MGMIRKKLLTLLLAALLLYPTPATRAQGDAKTWLLNQINTLRGQLGIHGYALNGALGAAAQQHSEYMAATGDISHTESNGSTPSSRAAANGYTGKYVSENIYGGTLATAADAWNFWINSSIHYAGLTNTRNNEIGIGVASSGNGTYFTLVFGYGTGVDAPPVPQPPNENPAPAPQQAPPTRRPAPPTQTFTPSPTIPTFTPTITWTVTPTWTATASTTPAPPTKIPIVLPTAAIVVAQAVDSPVPTTTQAPPTRPQQRLEATATGDIRDVLPYLLIGQVILLGIGVVSLVVRKK